MKARAFAESNNLGKRKKEKKKNFQYFADDKQFPYLSKHLEIESMETYKLKPTFLGQQQQKTSKTVSSVIISVVLISKNKYI